MSASSEEVETLDTLWGVPQIANFIRLGKRQTYHRLEAGHLPGKKVGSTWISWRSQLQARLAPAEENTLSAKRPAG